MLKYKPDFEQAQKYWDAFWNKEIIDRPCTCIWADNSVSPQVAPGTQPTSIKDFKPVWNQLDLYLATHAFLGEAIPGFRPGFGPDQFAGFLGAPLIMSPASNNTSWSEKIVFDWQSFLPLKIDENNPCWQKMKQFHEEAQIYCQDKCLLYNIDLHSNIDALEGLRGAQNLLYDLIDKPEIVLDAILQVRKIYHKVYDFFYQYGRKEQLGTAANLFMYSRGKYNPIQADFICLLSPDMFRKFVLPAIEEEANYLDHSCFHLDGPDALRHLDDILAVKKINAIQWVPGEGNKPQLEWPDLLKKIQSAGKSIILYGSPEEIKKIHHDYISELVVYNVHVHSISEGFRFLEWLKRNT